jgi:GT2 family glycosyltransferase
MAHGSTAKEIGEKNYADEAGRAAINDYLKRNKIRAEVLEVPDRPTNHRIKYQLTGRPIVSIIIPFKDKVDLLKACLKSIKNNSTYDNYELILISNNSQEQETYDFLESMTDKNIKIFEHNEPFNYSKLNNLGRQKANGKFLIFLNNDTEIVTSDWIEELIGIAGQPEIGAVGPLLLYPDLSIQHAGIILGMTGMAGHVFRKLKPGTLTPFWLPDWPRDYLAVTGACLAIEARKFDKVGGFNEDFIMAGSDVVLGLDLYEKGYRNAYWPYAVLLHHESKSVVSYKNAPISDYNNSLEHYRPYLNYGDPFFNPNLNLESEIPSLRNRYDK